MTSHPLSETRAAELWDAHKAETTVSWAEMKWSPTNACASRLSVMRAAFDAGREHADPTIPAEVTDEMVKSALRAEDSVSPHAGGDGIDGFRLADERRVRAALTAALAVATPADPRHDPRPWEDCTPEDIRKGDMVEARDCDLLRTGVAHHQNEVGRWFTEDGRYLTWGNYRPLRRIPAPTVTAEEVELPTEFGAVITDVEADFGEPVRFDRMVWTGWRWTYRDYSTTSGFIHAFTLPDGTRARRDGERPDGTPRFVKEDVR